MLHEEPDLTEMIEKVVENASAAEAEEIIRALSAKHRFSTVVIDRSWVRNEMDRQLDSFDESELEPFDAFSVRESIVDMALQRIHARHGEASVRELVTDDDTYAGIVVEIEEAVEPLRGIKRNEDYRYAVELLSLGRSMATVGSWNSFYAAVEWGRKIRNQKMDLYDIMQNIPKDAAGVPSDPPCYYGSDRVNGFRVHARDYSGSTTHSFDVEGY